MAKFQRHERGVPKKEQIDDPAQGHIRVQIIRMVNNRQLKGSLSKTVSVKDARVSEVFAAIEQALFGD